MSMTSYAHNREDVLLDRLFPRGLKGFYIDVGANDPVINSVTKHFYDLGWRGINVEPTDAAFARLEAGRARDVNLNVGLSDHEKVLTLHEFPPALSGLSTFSAARAAWHEEHGRLSHERSVPVTTLAKVCAEHVDTGIDFLNVGVEGHELEVLSGGDWSRWRPRVVVVRGTQPAAAAATDQQWEQVLVGARYIFAAFDGLSRYYLREEDGDLVAGLAAPVNVTDRYVPYEHAKAYSDLSGSYDLVSRQLAAARAANEALNAERAGWLGITQRMQALRGQYHRLERALTTDRARYEVLRQEVMETHDRCEALNHELVAMANQLAAAHRVVEGVSPISLAVARRLTQASTRYPHAGRAIARSLKLAGTARRALRG